MLFRKVQKIKFPFLREVATKVSEKYSLEDVYMDKQGIVCFTFKGYLEEDDIKHVLNTITPKEYQQNIKLKFLENYTFSTCSTKTHVFSIEGIDYKNLV